MAAARGISRARVALAWVLHKPVVTSPIVGASKPGHLEDAVAALNVRLAPEEIASLEAPYVPHPVVGFDASYKGLGAGREASISLLR